MGSGRGKWAVRRNDSSRAPLKKQIARLQAELAEAKEVLNAIRQGEVDAFVLPGPNGDRIFSLNGVEQPYRILIEEMGEGAATLAADGTILYCNLRLAELFKVPLERIIGSQFVSFLLPTDRRAFDALLQGARDGRMDGQVYLRV